MDLGCWPGSWTLYAARRVGSRGRVLGIDLKAVDFELPRNAQTRVEDARHFRGSNAARPEVMKTCGTSMHAHAETCISLHKLYNIMIRFDMISILM